MNSRERWTVYPLLFLAIGLALRAVAVPPDKLSVSVVEAGRIVCGEIVIAAEDDTKLVHVGRVKGGGGGRMGGVEGGGEGEGARQWGKKNLIVLARAYADGVA